MIYEYVCRACGHRFEVWATVAEKEKGLKAACPSCGDKDIRQALGSFAIGGRSRRGNLPACGCRPGEC